jgi:hypothetical protein
MDLQKAKDSDAINDQEYQAQKAKLLGNQQALVAGANAMVLNSRP